MKKYQFINSRLKSYDNEWYKLILQAKQQGISQTEVRTIISELKCSRPLLKKQL